MTQDALGMIETKGLGCAVEAANTMLKTAKVELLGKETVGDGFVTVFVKGDLGAIKAATDAAVVSVRKIGVLVSVNVIAKPHPGISHLIPNKLSLEKQ